MPLIAISRYIVAAHPHERRSAQSQLNAWILHCTHAMEKMSAASPAELVCIAVEDDMELAAMEG